LFPDLEFDLVDPAPFTCVATDKIRIHNCFFDDELASRFLQQNCKYLFISDVRSVDKQMEDKDKEARVEIDMQRQYKWHNLLKPVASMFKFRLPYPLSNTSENKTTYLRGDIFLPVWGGRTTTETRLIVSAEKHQGDEKVYDHRWYESLMFYFNTVTRTQYYEHNVNGEGLDHCFDCSSEIFILKQYLRKYSQFSDDTPEQAILLDREVAKLSLAITKCCSKSGRSLAL
jgi:cap2 methyltransferase